VNKKQKKGLIGITILWLCVFLGIGLFGLFSANNNYILAFFWILFLIGLLMLVTVLDKYVIIKIEFLKEAT